MDDCTDTLEGPSGLNGKWQRVDESLKFLKATFEKMVVSNTDFLNEINQGMISYWN